MIVDNNVKQLIDKSLQKSYTYSQYRDLMAQMLIQGMSTGQHQSETLTHYSMLNQVRMNRLDRTICITEKVQYMLKNLKSKYLLLVVTESWCGDAAQIMPVINRIAACSSNFEYRVVLRDENQELMDNFLTNGSKSIPKLLIIDAVTNQLVADWGPRPAEAAKLVQDLKEKYGSFNDDAKTELQKWYLYDKGLTTMQEISNLLSGIETGSDSKTKFPVL